MKRLSPGAHARSAIAKKDPAVLRGGMKAKLRPSIFRRLASGVTDKTQGQRLLRMLGALPGYYTSSGAPKPEPHRFPSRD